MGYAVGRNRKDPKHTPASVPKLGKNPYEAPTVPLGQQLSPQEKDQLKARNIDTDFLDQLTPGVVYVKMKLPGIPQPDVRVPVYKPDKPTKE